MSDNTNLLSPFPRQVTGVCVVCSIRHFVLSFVVIRTELENNGNSEHSKDPRCILFKLANIDSLDINKDKQLTRVGMISESVSATLYWILQRGMGPLTEPR